MLQDIQKLLIPAIIDYSRYGSSNLGTNQILFINHSESSEPRESIQIENPVFSQNRIYFLFQKLGIQHSIEEIVSGEFIQSTNSLIPSINSNIQLVGRQKYIANILKLVLHFQNIYSKEQKNNLNEEQILNYAQHIDLEEVKSFWTTMLTFEILYLNRKINDLGLWEWNNFGIKLYNQLVAARDKSKIFHEVNKILTYILYPLDSPHCEIEGEKKKNSLTLIFPTNFETVSIELKYNQFSTFQKLLDHIYMAFLSKLVPRHSYEKNWILEKKGRFIRKPINTNSLTLNDLDVLGGSELEIHLI